MLLVASCTGDTASWKAKQAEATAPPEAVSVQPFGLDNVPSMIRNKAQLTLPPIFPGISKLPASVRSVEPASRSFGRRCRVRTPLSLPLFPASRSLSARRTGVFRIARVWRPLAG